MKSQAPLLQATLLLVSVACSQVHGVVHKEFCTPIVSDVDVKVVGCESRTVQLNICAGTCLSEESQEGAACWCCKPVSKSPVSVEILCKNGNGAFRYKHRVYEHDQCTCSRCFENWIMLGLFTIVVSILVILLWCKWNTFIYWYMFNWSLGLILAVMHCFSDDYII